MKQTAPSLLILITTPCSGPDYTTVVGGQECTVSKLLEELYQKAAIANLWSLVRHTAGMLRKSVENLGAVSGCTYRVVRTCSLG